LIITSKQKQFLRGLAHSLEPYIIIGKHGLSKSAIQFIDKSLSDHELIKIKIKIGDKKELAPIIESKTSSSVVGMIGKIIILYRQSEDRENSKIKLP
tara:strand:+ start:4173 stop:4463 length:291 start_codon:yes stop_codon:yes gene_type:complete